MAGSNAEIQATLGLDDSEYRQKLQDAPGVAKNTLGAMSVAVGTMLAGMVTKVAGAIGGELKSTLTFWQTQEDAVNHLNRALNLSGAGKGWSDELQKVASDLQAVTKYGDEATLQVMALGLNMGISASQMEDATKTAMGLASSYNMSLETAMGLVAKASNGNTAMLARYGIMLDTTKSKQEQFNELLQKGKDLLPNAQAQTLSEKLAQVSNAYGDIKEKVGQLVSESLHLTEGADWLARKLSEIGSWMDENMPMAVYMCQTVTTELAGIGKMIWATLQPALQFIFECWSAGCENMASVTKWFVDNAGKILANLPEISLAVVKDIAGAFVEMGKMLIGIFADIGKGIWEALKTGSTDSLTGIADAVENRIEEMKGNIGKNTREALEEAGATELPELSAPDFGALIDGYKNLGDELARIADETDAQHERNLKEYTDRISNGRSKDMADGRGRKGAEGANGAEVNRSVDIVGSFSSKMLDGMMGANSPMAQIARGTKKNERHLENIERNTSDGMVEVY